MDFSNFGQIILRMVAIFIIALIVVRMMGNRTVGQFSPFDFVLMVGIGDIVGNVALERNEGLINGVEALLGLLILQQVLAWSSLKNKTLRKWFEGAPLILIENGQIVRENLVKSQFNLDDLRQELHKQGMDFTNIPEIKIARLESCGDFSIVKHKDMEPLTRKDLDNFINNLADNPLSQSGEIYTKLEQLSADIKILAEYVKQHSGDFNTEIRRSAPESIH